MYANTTLLTCDASQKKDISEETSGEGTDAFTAKLMAVKPKQYRWKSEDNGAPKSMGFIADEIEASFPECVRRTWRTDKVASRDEKDGKWKDDAGKEYAETAVDMSRTEEFVIIEPNWGIVYVNEPLQHAVIDTTAMLSLLVKAVRHLQIQSTAQKAEIALLKANVAIKP